MVPQDHSFRLLFFGRSTGTAKFFKLPVPAHNFSCLAVPDYIDKAYLLHNATNINFQMSLLIKI